MSDYTPGIGPIRDAWRHERARHAGESKPRVYDAEFDRWKAENDRQVAAKELTDAVRDHGLNGPVGDTLRSRAAAIVSEPSTPEQEGKR